MKKLIFLLFMAVSFCQAQDFTVDIANISGTDTSYSETMSNQTYSWGVQFYVSSLAGTKDGEVSIYIGNKTTSGIIRWALYDDDLFPFVVTQDTSIIWISNFNAADEVKIEYAKKNSTGGDVEVFIERYQYARW